MFSPFIRERLASKAYWRYRLLSLSWISSKVQSIFSRFAQRLGGYFLWQSLYDRFDEADRKAIIRLRDQLSSKPSFAIWIDTKQGDRPESLHISIQSIIDQPYANSQVFITTEAKPDTVFAKHTRIHYIPRESTDWSKILKERLLDFDYFLALKSGDRLAADSLYLAAATIAATPEVLWLYGDEDRISAGMRTQPTFYTCWNQDLFLSQYKIPAFSLVRTSCISPSLDFDDYDFGDFLELIVSIPPEKTHHISHILYHCQSPENEELNSKKIPQDLTQANDFLRQRGEAVDYIKPMGQSLRIYYKLPEPQPLVSIIIPTRDRVELLRQCISSIETKTDYSSFEFIIVDNKSREPEAIEYLNELASKKNTTVLRYKHEFNYARINNIAADKAHGQFLAFLNNDTEVLAPEWLREMTMHANRETIGLVGAKLYYPDMTVQHAGIILHNQAPALTHSLHKGFSSTSSGYDGRLDHCQCVSAVVAACMVIKKERFQTAGRFDEDLPTDYNDIDLCLAVRSHGWNILFSPFAQLIHHESASRGQPITHNRLADIDMASKYLRRKWPHLIEEDPYYSPNLDFNYGDFSLAFPPRKKKLYKR